MPRSPGLEPVDGAMEILLRHTLAELAERSSKPTKTVSIAQERRMARWPVR